MRPAQKSTGRRYRRQQVIFGCIPITTPERQARIMRDEIERIAEQRDLLIEAVADFLGRHHDGLMTPSMRHGILDLADTLTLVTEIEREARAAG